MDIFENKLSQPSDDKYLWRYFKNKEHINNFLNGNIYFSKLTQFEDYYEAITPLHSIFLNYTKRSMTWLPFKEEPWESVKTNSLQDNLPFLMVSNEFKLLKMNLYHLHNKKYTDVEVSNLIAEFSANYEQINADHRKKQSKTYTNCWFIGDYEESALMWRSYSAPEGIAVCIPFKEFKEVMNRFFTYWSEKYTFRVTAGSVKYSQFYNSEEWYEEVKSGVPLAFFKHSSYKSENEYRIVVESDEVDFDQNMNIFVLFNHFHVILHPSSLFSDMEHFRKKKRGLLVRFSDLSYNVIKKPI